MSINSMPKPIRGFTMRTTASASTFCSFRVSQRDSHTGIRREGPGRTDERPAHGDVRRNALRPGAAFQVQQLNVCGKRIAYAVAAVANRHAPRGAFQYSVVHGDNVAHSRLRRAANGLCLPEERSALIVCPKQPRPWVFKPSSTPKR